ncbi:MAG: cysteine sulfinate desulfinase [Acidobacteria bacterium RIFCSPLOWO2_02_FULL_68_18]|nr:MAG: cysteine sulfinate desulfinase [Acidobacteria bacterium RIFCSPLOWO2_02_FULL_68_18]OFW50463.1 MAG: cysteine sulfinate desulfinase [Acidobacteria bacterium RIFCSPLOWO2_12_FULL_68_19]
MASVVSTRRDALDVAAVRRDFPILRQRVHGRPLIYLDNAATTQKPRVMLEALQRYYSEENANVHRGVHSLSGRATDAYDAARETIRRFLNAADSREIVFVRGTTEGINLVAQTYGRARIGAGDEIVLSEMEHHSNIVPWQILCEEKGARLRVVPMTDAGELRLDEYESLLNECTRMVAVAHVSNVLGTVNPVAEIARLAVARGIPVLVDGAQAVAHMPVDVQALGCDFYAFSGHKVLGPTGIGVLYGRRALLEAMPVYQGGGGQIASVTFDRTTYAALPYKYEAGTPNIAGVIGLAAALDYVTAVGLDRIAAYERDLSTYAASALSGVPGLRLTGTARERAAVLSFVLGDVHPHDIGTILDREGVAIRAGHHCCQPLMRRLGVPATARASLALYNTREEVDALVAALERVREVFE